MLQWPTQTIYTPSTNHRHTYVKFLSHGGELLLPFGFPRFAGRPACPGQGASTLCGNKREPAAKTIPGTPRNSERISLLKHWLGWWRPCVGWSSCFSQTAQWSAISETLFTNTEWNQFITITTCTALVLHKAEQFIQYRTLCQRYCIKHWTVKRQKNNRHFTHLTSTVDIRHCTYPQHHCAFSYYSLNIRQGVQRIPTASSVQLFFCKVSGKKYNYQCITWVWWRC